MNYKAKEILLRAKKDVFSGNLGDNLTKFIGEGLDFREIREYAPGDDVRKINWNATAKSGGVNSSSSIKINLFNNEQELNIIIAFMVSGSINFGSIKLKQDIVAEILALLSFSTLKNRNNLQVVFFSKAQEKYYPPTKNQSVVYKILEDSLEFDCLQKSVCWSSFCDFTNDIVRQKSLIFIVSDFYGDVDLSAISHQNELYALIVRDRFEEYPVISGEYEFIDPTSFSGTKVNMSKPIANHYQQLIRQNDEKLQEHFLQHKISSGKIYTDDDIYFRLSQIVKG